MTGDGDGLIGLCDTTPLARGGRTEDSQARIDRLQELLNRRLGPEFISTRQGGGGARISYIEGWRVIQLANEVFGFNGWFSAVKDLTVDYCDTVPETGRFNIGVSAIIRVWLRDGASHEDVGYGRMENAKTKGEALDKAKKEAVTDALKRALRNFGNLLGNCLYDKAHLAAVASIKPQKMPMDWNSLHRADSSYRPASTSHSANAIASTSAVKPPVVPVAATKPVMPPPRVPIRAQTIATPAATRPPAQPAKPAPAQPVAVSRAEAEAITRPPTTDLLRDSDDELFTDLFQPPDAGEASVITTDDSGFVDGVSPNKNNGDASTLQAQEDAEKAMRKLLAEKKQAAFRKQREAKDRTSRSPEQPFRPSARDLQNEHPHMRAQTSRPTPTRAHSTVVVNGNPRNISALPALHVGGNGARIQPQPEFQSARTIKRAPDQARDPLSELDIDERGDVIKRARV